MPTIEMILPEWAEVRASSRHEAVEAKTVERISQGISKGGTIGIEVTELCQIQRRPGPGSAGCRGCDKRLVIY